MTHGFRSHLAADLHSFLEFKRALGFSYQHQEFTLRRFDRFLAENAPRKGAVPLEALVRRWLAEQADGRKRKTAVCTHAIIRQFLLFRRRTDPTAFVPDRDLVPRSSKTGFVPYIFSDTEIRTVLEAALRLPGPPFHGRTIRLLILVLYCTGLRFGEAVRLKVRDVDLGRRVFDVRESKGRSRLVPFHADLARELRTYRRERQLIALPSTETFFVHLSGRGLRVPKASGFIRALLREIGLKPARGRVGPRPYDFRATFAVHRLTRWHARRADLAAKLPLLSAYMGHVGLLGTEVYLRSTPELMALAGQRFHSLLRGSR